MSARTELRLPERSPHEETDASTAAAYNRAVDDYLNYADGDPNALYAFEGAYSYADRQVWDVLDRILTEHRSSGADTIRILDAGCGPGTWLRRLIVRAKALGFQRITARGFDVAEAQVRRARLLSRELSTTPGIDVSFGVGDLSRRLDEADRSVDLCLCLYGVLNHLPPAKLPDIFEEFARVTAGRFVGSVRAAGSMPTIFVDSLQEAKSFRQDNERGQCEVEFNDGRQAIFDCHLFTSIELRSVVGAYFGIEDLRGLDMFHSRFAPDPRWNPPSLGVGALMEEELARLEGVYCKNPEFMDRAAHLFFVAHATREPQENSIGAGPIVLPGS